MEKLTSHLSLYFLVPRRIASQLIDMENASSVKEFILLGLSEDPGVQKICFVLFLFFYMIILAGNLLIVITVISSQRLSSPMYFFLCYLSFVDICYSSVTALLPEIY